MSDEQQTPQKRVPPRNDFKAQPVFVKGSIADQAGARKGYVRQWFAKDDPQNPLYWRKRIDQHMVGDPEVGYCQAEGWTVVQRKDAKDGGRKRDDDTSGIETALTHGDLVCMETTVENFAVYQEYDRLRDQAQAKKLSHGDNESIRDSSGRPVASYRARVGDGLQFADHKDLLNQGA